MMTRPSAVAVILPSSALMSKLATMLSSKNKPSGSFFPTAYHVPTYCERETQTVNDEGRNDAGGRLAKEDRLSEAKSVDRWRRHRIRDQSEQKATACKPRSVLFGPSASLTPSGTVEEDATEPADPVGHRPGFPSPCG
ncbi:hypothetical protein EYF80_039509 [Liparis tanakae]|uniref:Uncharacterized protein n=1 Tax=Liparis tanakae TaxID=230148 RepID=A0A4Z2GC57_9TELE|nr:hypothetical protein EYF80_039509 [Liparis tanakae]